MFRSGKEKLKKSGKRASTRDIYVKRVGRNFKQKKVWKVTRKGTAYPLTLTSVNCALRSLVKAAQCCVTCARSMKEPKGRIKEK